MKNKIAELPLMPKATAVWLIDNTSLTFQQIGKFCGMHDIEVKGIADGEVAIGIIGRDPTVNGQINAEDINVCEKDPKKDLILRKEAKQYLNKQTSKYTPVSKRQDKPDAIAWIVKYHQYIPIRQIVKLIGTTKITVEAVRDRTHWNISNIKPKDPVLLGLCKQLALDEIIERFRPDNKVEQSED